MPLSPFGTGFSTQTGRSVTVVVAASNAADHVKKQADYVCDGTADEAQINAALALLDASYGGIVLLSAGKFNIASPIMFPDTNYNALKGTGRTSTEIYLSNNSNCVMIAKTTPTTTKYRNQIESLGLNGNYANNAVGTYGIDVTGMGNCVIRDVHIYGTKSHGIYGLTDGSHTTSGVIMFNVSVQSAQGWGFYLAGVAGWMLNTISSSTCASGGLTIQQGYEIHGVNLSFDQDSNGNSIDLASLKRGHFVNVWAAPLTGYKAGIKFYNCQDCTVQGYSWMPPTGANNTIGIYFYASNGNTCSNCVVDGFSIDGSNITGERGISQDVDGTGLISGCRVLNGSFTSIATINYTGTSTDSVQFRNNLGYIQPSETRSIAGNLTAGLQNAFTFTWQNPEAQSIHIIEVMIDITTAGGTAGAILDVGTAPDATTHSNDLINGANLNAIDNHVSTTRLKLAAAGGATDYVTGQILNANASSLVGKYYITYMGV